MAKYKLSPRVISVSIRGTVYHKKDNDKKVVVFDDEKSFSPAELESAYRSGFLVKIEGKKEIHWVDEKKSVEKVADEKAKTKRQINSKINGIAKQIKALEAKMPDASDEEKLQLEKEIAEKGGEIETLKEGLE